MILTLESTKKSQNQRTLNLLLLKIQLVELIPLAKHKPHLLLLKLLFKLATAPLLVSLLHLQMLEILLDSMTQHQSTSKELVFRLTREVVLITKNQSLGTRKLLLLKILLVELIVQINLILHMPQLQQQQVLLRNNQSIIITVITEIVKLIFLRNKLMKRFMVSPIQTLKPSTGQEVRILSFLTEARIQNQDTVMSILMP